MSFLKVAVNDYFETTYKLNKNQFGGRICGVTTFKMGKGLVLKCHFLFSTVEKINSVISIFRYRFYKTGSEYKMSPNIIRLISDCVRA